MSYATEDAVLAEWLTLKLTAEGFKVWCDRTKLLGGESYPVDITKAITNSTFRMLALMSKSSVNKPNPVSERTLALNIGAERKVDFVIPIKVDEIKPTELDFMTSNRTFIPFNHGWAHGLSQLLKKLNEIDAPKFARDGKVAVSRWLLSEESIVSRPERVWSNLFQLYNIPKEIIHFSVNNMPDFIQDKWPFYRKNEYEAWAFGAPTSGASISAEEGRHVEWRKEMTVAGIKTFNIVSSILRQALILHCLQKGLLMNESGSLYFPLGLLANDKIHYTTYGERNTYVKVVGTKSFRTNTGQPEKSRYHLCPVFSPIMSRFGEPCIQLNIRFHWTDLQGNSVARGKSNRRRRALTKSWWNHQWLSRIIACSSWFADGRASVELLSTNQGIIRISGTPIQLTSQFGIDESVFFMTTEEEDKDDEVLEENLEDENDEEENQGQEATPSADED